MEVDSIDDNGIDNVGLDLTDLEDFILHDHQIMYTIFQSVEEIHHLSDVTQPSQCHII